MSSQSSQKERVEGSQAPHQNSFGFIRLLLSILVVLQHSFFVLTGNLKDEPMNRLGLGYGLGTLGVFGFFALSGYLITQSWARSPKLAGFLRNRVLRIYPGFIVAALITVFVVGRLGAGPSYYEQFSLLQLVKCLVTLTIPGNVESFDGLAVKGILNGSLWSIPAEFACYLLVAAAGLTRMLTFRWPLLIALVVTLAVPTETMVAPLLPWLRMPYSNLVQQFVGMVPFFLAGMCAYLFRDRIRYTRRGAAIAGALLLVCLAADVVSRAALAILGAYLLFALAFCRAPRLQGIGQKVDLSYGVYLYHWPCQLAIVWYFRELSPWLLFPVSLLGAGLLALGSWHFVEKPCLRLKRGTKRTAARAASVVGDTAIPSQPLEPCEKGS
jgi:peptidoglycan/LPS O-acetylase OafA/YrhL